MEADDRVEALADAADGAGAAAATRPCPFCAEPIKVEAIKCRWCGEMLATTAATGAENARSPWHWLVPVNFARGLWWSVVAPEKLAGTGGRPLEATAFALLVGVIYTFLTNIFATNVGYYASGYGVPGVSDYVDGFVRHLGFVVLHAADPIIFVALPFGVAAFIAVKVAGRPHRFSMMYAAGCFGTGPMLFGALAPFNDMAFWAGIVACVIVGARIVRAVSSNAIPRLVRQSGHDPTRGVKHLRLTAAIVGASGLGIATLGYACHVNGEHAGASADLVSAQGALEAAHDAADALSRAEPRLFSLVRSWSGELVQWGESGERGVFKATELLAHGESKTCFIVAKKHLVDPYRFTFRIHSISLGSLPVREQTVYGEVTNHYDHWEVVFPADFEAASAEVDRAEARVVAAAARAATTRPFWVSGP